MRKPALREKKAQEAVVEDELHGVQAPGVQEGTVTVAKDHAEAEEPEEVPADILESPGYFDEATLAPAPSTSLVESGPLQRYMAEVSRYPLLSLDEEQRISRKYREDGDVRAAYTLVVSNLRLVVKIAYEFRRGFANLMDLIQEGNIGLMRAVEKFDPYRGVKLSSYAAWWIRAYIIRYVLNNWSLVKIGTTQNQRRLFYNIKKAQAELEAAGFRPEPKLLAAHLNVREDEVVEMQKRLSGPDVSLDAPLDADSQSTRMDFVAAHQPDQSERLADAEFRAVLREKLHTFRATLAERDRIIFDRRLLTDDPVTLRELGEEFGVSRERVRQLEADVKRRLKKYLSEIEGLQDAIA